LSDVKIDRLIKFHRAHGRLATLTAIQPPSRYGLLSLNKSRVTKFREKPLSKGGWINGGFFVLSPKVIDRIDGNETNLEQEPLRSLAAEGQLQAYLHKGFWHPMDTLRDKQALEQLWESGKAPWKLWR
jgi:glucose-1-phosphate cytidylyltransferase